MDPFVAQLKQLCAAHPTRAKWVFVPSHGIGRTLGDRLVLEGTNWANLRFVTPLDVALPMGAPFLVERGIDPSEEGLGPALVMRLLLGLPGANPKSGYFRPLGDQPQMAVALWSTMRELRMAGVRSADLKPDAFASAEKFEELRALLAAYENFLATHSRGDLATVFEEAAKHVDWCPIQVNDCWLVQPDIVWPPLAQKLIDATPGERMTPAAIEVPGLSRPRRVGNAIAARHPAPSSSPASSFFHAGGAEAEVEEVFRRILASGKSLDEAEIVGASPPYAALIWEKAIRYDWPVTIAQGIPAAMTRPGRALLAFTDWLDDDFSAGHLRRMLQSGDLGLGAATITAGRAARLLVKAQAAWGRETYRLSLHRLASSSRAGAKRDDLAPEVREGLEARARQAEELSGWIQGVLAGVPTPEADGKIELRQLVECARQFIDQSSARASALDSMAGASLADAIGDLRALGDFRCSLSQALRFLNERVESVNVGADRPRPGHLHVSSLSTAGLAGRPLMFVVGLEEGRVFPAPYEDPILLDVERQRISATLAQSTDRTDEAVYAALSRLTTMAVDPRVTTTFSYSCRDLREYRETYASWVMLHFYRLASGTPAAAYKDLHEHLGPPKSCVPESPANALGEARWWLHGITRAGEKSRSAVLKRYAALAAGATAVAARESDRFTEFDGHVPAAGKVLDPANPTLVISPTQLEDAASCPFRHFLKRGLSVDALEAGERDRDVWLDPLLRGSLLHDLYAQLLRRCREGKRRVKLPEDQEWLLQRGREALRDLSIEMPPPSSEVGERETHLLLDDLKLFVEEEANADPSRTPIGFEVAFGRTGDEEDPLAQAEPVIVDVGGGMKLKIAGRIDRIDQTDQTTFEIVDYKTGGYWADAWRGTFAGGTRLQHALYGLAAVQLLRQKYKKPVVSGAEYYFPSAKGKQERKNIPAPSLARIGSVLADLREVIAQGLFVHAPDMSECKWCDFGHACGQNAAARAKAKVADQALAPFVRLVAHE